MWEAFKDFIFWVIQFFYGPFLDWGMSIIVVTIIFRAVLTPLMYKQTKSNYQMQKIQPLINDLQARYGNDQARVQEEMQKLYAEAHFNPLAGCIPMLLQMPIFIALFQVLREMGDRVGSSHYSFYNLVPNLVYTPSDALVSSEVSFIPYITLLIIFAGATFLPMVLQQMGNKNNPQRNQTLIMSAVMTIMMLWIGWSSPAGVLLFWGVSSLIGIAQQQISLRIVKNKDAELEAQKGLEPVKIDVERKTKKPRPKRKR